MGKGNGQCAGGGTGLTLLVLSGSGGVILLATEMSLTSGKKLMSFVSAELVLFYPLWKSFTLPLGNAPSSLPRPSPPLLPENATWCCVVKPADIPSKSVTTCFIFQLCKATEKGRLGGKCSFVQKPGKGNVLKDEPDAVGRLPWPSTAPILLSSFHQSRWSLFQQQIWSMWLTALPVPGRTHQRSRMGAQLSVMAQEQRLCEGFGGLKPLGRRDGECVE